MKNGIYKVSFNVQLTDCNNEEEAHQEVAAMVNDVLDEDGFPEVNFELVEEFDIEYHTEENELEELNF